MGAGGRSLWRRWCMAAGSSAVSASHCCLRFLPSWRTGTSRRRWSSTGGTARRWTGRARSGPGGGCWPDREEASRCGTSPQEWLPWLLPWWYQGRHWRQGCERGCRWRRPLWEGSGPEGRRTVSQARRGARWKVALRSSWGHQRLRGQDLREGRGQRLQHTYFTVRFLGVYTVTPTVTCKSWRQVTERGSTRREGIGCVDSGRGDLAQVGVWLVVRPRWRRLHLSGIWGRKITFFFLFSLNYKSTFSILSFHQWKKRTDNSNNKLFV